MQREQRLRDAISSGEIIIIKYHGGSQPGSIREIVPRKIEDGRLSAICIASDALKHFKVDLIETLDAMPESGTTYSPDLTAMDHRGLKELIALHLETLRALRWDVEWSEKRIHLFGRFKNGKRRKTPEAGIDFYSDNTTRPWYIFSKGMDKAKTFSLPGPAFAILLEQAEILASKKY